METGQRVEWQTTREKELSFYIAEKDGEGWKFYERSTWENKWYGVPSTPALIAKAESLLPAKE